MAVSEESEEIWKGRVQLGPLKMGAVDSFALSSSNAVWHVVFRTNCASFVNRENKGEASLDQFSINLR